MQHGVAQHHVGRLIREGHAFNKAHAEVPCRQPRLQQRGQLPYMLHALGIGVERKDLAALPQQVHQIAPIPAARVEHPHPGLDIAAQNLIEHIDIDLPELFPNT